MSLSFVPDMAKNSCQNLLTNIGSQSLIMDMGIPCNLTIFSTNFSTKILAVKGCVSVMKWAYLLSRSTNTKMVSLP